MAVFRKYIIAIILIIFFDQLLYSQELTGIDKFKNLREEISLNTDRSLYFTGEDIWIKALVRNAISGKHEEISKVIYLEMLDNKNFPVKQLMIKADGSSGMVRFSVPRDIRTGNYLLRAYTRWMENWSPDQFATRIISVINPFERVEQAIFRPEGIDPGQKIKNSASSDGTKIQISIPRKAFGTREKISFDVKVTDPKGDPLDAELSVSVIKSVLADPGTDVINSTKQELRAPDSLPGYLPEAEGHLVSGYIRMKITDEPVKNADLSLSFVGKKAECMFTKSDEKGQFFFIVNQTGTREMVIQPVSQDISGYYIDLKQPFSNKFPDYKLPQVSLDSSRLNDINKAIIAAQVKQVYKETGQLKEPPKNLSNDFFETPEKSIFISDYIELSDVKEAVKEIIPNLVTSRQNGRYQLRVINNIRGAFDNEPLVLFDGVPVYDMSKVLNVLSKEIERVDIVTKKYFYSDIVFDGVVNFVTKKGNLSAYNFDNSVFRQATDFYSPPEIFHSPEYTSDTLKHIPDFRNTLYWNPSLRTGSDGKGTFSFYSSDEEGEFTIVISGVTSDGKLCSSRTTFFVK